jgi:tetratricopeptide (TPR) repeat protein
MKYKLLVSLFIASFIFSSNCFSQESDTPENKAKFYYDSEEYQLSIPLFTQLIISNPLNHNYLKYRGNCYLEIGQNDKAIHDYLSALKLSLSSELFFNLGNAYERLNQSDSAIYYFNEFNKLEPKHSDGYVRLCVIYMYSHPEWGDTAIYFASQAVKKEPEKAVNLNFLAMAYYSAGHYQGALEAAVSGLAIDSTFSLLYQTAGISSFFMKNYTEAISYFDRAYMANPKDFTLLDYKIQSILLKNTDPGKITSESGRGISFKEISSENLKMPEEIISDPDGIHSYRRLLQKLRSNPTGMSLDEFFLLYYAATMQADYDPYHKSIEVKTKKDGPMAQAAALEDALLKNPTDFPLYLDLADFYHELGNEEKYFENRFRYFGFIEGLKATGDGLTPETALIINDNSHEYSIMISFGYHPKSQKTVKLKKHYYDVIEGKDENNNDIILYFNIDKPNSAAPKSLKN